MLPIQSPRWSEYLRRIIGHRGALNLSALPDAMPTIDLEDERPELALPQGVKLWHASNTQVAVAGQYASLTIRNESTTHLVVIEGWTVRRLAWSAAYISHLLTQAATGVYQGAAPRDSRVSSSIGNVVGIRAESLLFQPAGNSSPTAEGDIWQQPLVLSPGWGLQLGCLTANLGTNVYAWGYAREASPDELQLQG